MKKIIGYIILGILFSSLAITLTYLTVRNDGWEMALVTWGILIVIAGLLSLSFYLIENN